VSYALAAFGGALAMALIEWLWTRDWSTDEPDTDFLIDHELEDEL